VGRESASRRVFWRTRWCRPVPPAQHQKAKLRHGTALMYRRYFMSRGADLAFAATEQRRGPFAGEATAQLCRGKGPDVTAAGGGTTPSAYAPFA
jgi:hypothetical protein